MAHVYREPRSLSRVPAWPLPGRTIISTSTIFTSKEETHKQPWLADQSLRSEVCGSRSELVTLEIDLTTSTCTSAKNHQGSSKPKNFKFLPQSPGLSVLAYDTFVWPSKLTLYSVRLRGSKVSWRDWRRHLSFSDWCARSKVAGYSIPQNFGCRTNPIERKM